MKPETTDVGSNSWPTRSRRVERVRNIPYDEFVERFVKTETPAIIEGVISKEAQELLTPERFAADYGSTRVRVLNEIPRNFLSDFTESGKREMPLSEFVDWLKSPERKLPCYANQLKLREFPGLDEKLSFESVQPGLRPEFLWFGSAGSNIGLHFDPSDGYLAQVWGRKAFYLIPFKESGKVYPFPDDATRSLLDLRTFDVSKYPKMKNLEPYADELGPGDLLFTPKYCWHYFWGLTDSISVSTFVGMDRSAGRVAELIRLYGPVYLAGALKQMVWHGVLRRPFEVRAYGWPPTGFILWLMIVNGIKGALKLGQKPPAGESRPTPE